MENVVLKANRYRIVDNSAFEMPLPLKFTVWKCEAPICEYLVSEDEEVSYTIITRFKELMITTIHRPLDISDIYYLFSCRVFQDKTPYTYPILDRMGIEKYNVYNILRRTHGITPYDDYWIRFDGETTTFEQACGEFDKYLIAPEAQPVPMISYPSGEYRPGRSTRPPKQPEADVSSILNQHKVDVASIMEESKTPEAIAPETSYAPAPEVENNKMSQDDIEALLRSAGISDSPAPEPVSDIQVDPATRSQEESSGGVMSQDEVQRMLDEMNMSGGSEKPAESAEPAEPAEPVETPTEEIIEPAEPSGGKMSQDDIEKLLAAALGGNDDSDSDEPEIVENNAPEAPVNDEPAPAESSAPSGGKMSQEDIEKLLAANAPAEPSEPTEPAEPVPAPEPAPAESPAPSGGKMSQEDIEKLLAANAPAEPAEPTEPAEPVPTPEPAPAESSAPSGGKMSQEDIEKLLAANAPAEPSEPAAPAPEPAPAESSAPSGGKMSQEDIEKLLAANAPAEPSEPAAPAPEPAPAESSAPSGGKMSQEDIEKLLAANAPAEPSEPTEPTEPTEPAEPVPAPEPAPAESSAPFGGKMSQEDIEKLLAANAPAEPSEPTEPAEPVPAPEPAPAESPAPSGGKMSQADIEALLNSMQDEANK